MVESGECGSADAPGCGAPGVKKSRLKSIHFKSKISFDYYYIYYILFITYFISYFISIFFILLPVFNLCKAQ